MTTNFITKEHFVGLINSLQAQYQKDKECAHKIGQIFNSESPEELYDRLFQNLFGLNRKIAFADSVIKAANKAQFQHLQDEVGQWPGNKYDSHFIKHPIVQIEGIIKKVKHLFNQGVPSICTVNALLDSTDYYIHVLKEGSGIKANNEG